tara:strand:+ start:308 stop:961 length:654 start_codon:yes stop_codon:yes gene_type:complete
MVPPLDAILMPSLGLIFRITHIDNLDWLLENGLHCRSSAMLDPNFKPIGDQKIISSRREWLVPIAPCGTLSDYIPFYFTPRSMMFYNILTGYRGVRQVSREHIIIIFSSIYEIEKNKLEFVFTDTHAITATTRYMNNLGELKNLPWDLWQRSDFRHDPNHPDKTKRYQAEALVHRHVPINLLTGIACCNESIRANIESKCQQANMEIPAVTRSHWYP